MSNDAPVELPTILRKQAASRLAGAAYYHLHNSIENPVLADGLAFLLVEHDLELTFAGGAPGRTWALIHTRGDVDDVQTAFLTSDDAPDLIGDALDTARARLGYDQ